MPFGIHHDYIAGYVANQHRAWETSIAQNIHADNIAAAAITQHEGSITHQNLSGAGSNTHAQIDSHIADSALHFSEASIDHANILNIGTNTHAQIDSHISGTGADHSYINQAVTTSALPTFAGIDITGTGAVNFDGSGDYSIFYSSFVSGLAIDSASGLFIDTVFGTEISSGDFTVNTNFYAGDATFTGDITGTDALFTGHVGIGSGASIPTTQVLSINETETGNSTIVGLIVRANNTYNSTFSANLRGNQAIVTKTDGTLNSSGNVLGYNAAVHLKGATTTTVSSGDVACFRNEGSVADTASVYAYNVFLAKEPTLSGTGAITNLYGLYVNDMTNGTNNYAIYTNDGEVSLGDIVNFRYAGTAADTNSPTHINTPTGVAAAQATWLKVKVNGTDSYIPVWQ